MSKKKNIIEPSLVLLTMNRFEAVRKSLVHNIKNAGYHLHEIIWVDNGSSPTEYERLNSLIPATTYIRNISNQGVARGYNQGLAMVTGTHVVITGCDRLMPDNWLKTWAEHIEAIPDTGVISMYSDDAFESIESKLPPRLTGPVCEVNGKSIQPCIPFEARIHSVYLLKCCGFFREDFGLYSYEDNEWAARVERVSQNKGWINYSVPNVYAEHVHDGVDFLMPDGTPYREFKKNFIGGPGLEKYKQCEEQGFVYYNPYI